MKTLNEKEEAQRLFNSVEAELKAKGEENTTEAKELCIAFCDFIIENYRFREGAAFICIKYAKIKEELLIVN